MKKLILSLALTVLFSNPFAQTNQEDVANLRKSNTALKKQLNEQRNILLEQVRHTDSVIFTLQTAISEEQAAISNDEKAIGEEAIAISNMQIHINNMTNSMAKRKTYAMGAAMAAILVVLLYMWYLIKRLNTMDNEIKEWNETIKNKIGHTDERITQVNESVFELNKELDELKARAEKQMNENNEKVALRIAHTNESIAKLNENLTKEVEHLKQQTTNIQQQLDGINETISNLNKGVNMTIDNHIRDIRTVNGLLQEKLTKSVNELNAQMAALSKKIK